MIGLKPLKKQSRLSFEYSYFIRYIFIIQIVSVIIILLCNSCNSDIENSSINLMDNQDVSISDVFEEVRIVELENTEGSLVAQISQVVYYGEKFYVLDSKQQKIFCFDKTGKFISTISQQGQGPGEYVYVSSIALDDYNKHLVFLSPPTQQLLVFDLDGNFLKKLNVSTESVMGLNKVFTLNNSIYLLTSLTENQLVFFDGNKKTVIKKDFPLPVLIPQLIPLFNTYQLNGRTFVNPALSQVVLEVTEKENRLHYSFDYGLLNNTDRQISVLQNFFRDSPDIHSQRRHELIRSDGYLNHKLIKVMESNRFIIKLVAIENSIKHVIIDKTLDETFVFDFFKEDIVINMHFDIHQERYLIAYEARNFRDEESNKEFFGPWYPFYKADYFNKSILREEDVLFIDQHNPMTDNPFLVVYTFKE